MSSRPLLWKLAIAAALLAPLAGCGPKIEPEIASAAGEPAYATDYPAELTSVMDRLNTAENKTKELSGKFSGYPDALKSPPWPKVIVVVDKADAEGRAQARSQSMLVAQMLIVLGYLLFLAYPAVIRILLVRAEPHAGTIRRSAAMPDDDQ